VSGDQRAAQESVVDGLELGSAFLLAGIEGGVTVEPDERVTVHVPFADPRGGGRSELLGLVDDFDVDEAGTARQRVGRVP
jgi:hypothetical protein